MPIDLDVVLNRIDPKAISENNIHNLKTLWNRKSGQILYAAADGKIKHMGLWQWIFYTFSGATGSYRKTVNQGLERAIRQLTDNIDNLSLRTDGDDDKVAQEQTKAELISELFFRKLAPLSRNIYQRDLKESVLKILETRISVEENEISKEATEKYRSSYKAAKLWANLGNIDALGGASGSYRISQGKILNADGTVLREKRSIGIFKPSDEEPLASSNNRIMQKIKRWLLQFPILGRPISGSLFQTVAGQAYLAEVTAKIVERHIIGLVKEYLETGADIDSRLKTQQDWLELVTDTQVVHFDLRGKGRRVGSFQLWVEEEHREASEFFGVNEYYRKESNVPFIGSMLRSFVADVRGRQPTIEEQKKMLPAELFDLLVIIDYTIGNGDRHGHNWFITLDRANNASGIRLIDGGQAMAPEHPGMFTLMELHNRYIWRNLPLANEGFTPLAKFIINKLSDAETRGALRKEILELYNHHQRMSTENSVTEDRLKRMGERLDVMHRCQNHTKRHLADIRTARNIRAALSP